MSSFVESQPSKSSIFSAMFLVAGTIIGGGMLALPVATGISGFVPSIAMMVICWLAMTSTALLLLEVTLWMEDGVHVSTMTQRILGNWGKVVSWILYLFVCFASVIAYTAEGAVLVSRAIEWVMQVPVSKEIGSIVFLGLFGSVVYLGSTVVGRVNSILFIALVVAYVILVATGFDEVKPSLLVFQNWNGIFLAIPLLLTIFSFQTMVPSLAPYLKRHAQSLRWAVVGGTTTTFLIYFIWQSIILGIVPVEGTNGLAAALMLGKPATPFLEEHVIGKWVATFANYFAFFAIVTSFLGIAMGLFDFLSDGLKIKKVGFGKVFLGLLIVVPSFICATYFEGIFFLALESTGGYGDSILNGMIPVLMVWIGRYKLGYQGSFKVGGGKPFLIAVFCFFLFAFIIQVLIHTGITSKWYPRYEIVELRSDLELE